MSPSSRKLDRLQATFDHDGIVANAGLIVPATLMVRLGLEALIDTWVKTGSARPGRKVLTAGTVQRPGGAGPGQRSAAALREQGPPGRQEVIQVADVAVGNRIPDRRAHLRRRSRTSRPPPSHVEARTNQRSFDGGSASTGSTVEWHRYSSISSGSTAQPRRSAGPRTMRPGSMPCRDGHRQRTGHHRERLASWGENGGCCLG